MKLDKLLHFSISMCLTASYMQISENINIRYILVPGVILGLGILKEIIDKFIGGSRSIKDLIADFAGIVSAILLDIFFRVIINFL